MKQCFWADAVNSHGYRNPLPVPARAPQRQLPQQSPNPYQSIYGINPQQQQQRQQQFYNSQEQQRQQQQYYAGSSAGVRPLQPLAVSPI